ncbi:hypothetical protein [Nocardioides sp. AE5]|uniref:hypothetical protein n=1 Tax=Nocardioides sp. AE5 TaxID=2962573 RepID=UPI0028821590|nr:hypothetical protein [Nocardioides sp. AE5]MDT0202711.1 hypothetical protein [Nocardioides sp. AE5]
MSEAARVRDGQGVSAVPASRFAGLSRAQLAVVVPELLLIGQLIDRSGMAWCISAFGREVMAEIAIEEWAASSPIYTRRMQHALGYAPEVAGHGDVPTIFKGLQLDIGAPPQFMDFRYRVDDPWTGEFHLDHCGALMDVEPMGEEYVRSMCHDIEDPTFDATAVATNPRAQVRPIHRPPRAPADRHPHCAWTVRIRDDHPPVSGIPLLAVNEASRAASLELAPIEPGGPGLDDYAGPLLSDLDFTAFSHAALVRIADEVCLQMALLDRAFGLAVGKRATDVDQLLAIRRKQLTGIAGVASARLARALLAPASVAGAMSVLAVHPLFNPAAYVTASFDAASVTVTPGPAHEDDAWISLCGPDWTDALRAAVGGVDLHLDVAVSPVPAAAGTGAGWRADVVRRDEPVREADEVAVVRFSTGTDFAFETRRSLPIFVV